MKNVLYKNCREYDNTHFMFNNYFFFENLTCFWDNVEKYSTGGKPQMTIWRMCIAC
jgi:hypothetical protein